tara:strand:- start:1167 stop:1649 length:483 start_codon:yes stop_codon:yes gene_type:complete
MVGTENRVRKIGITVGVLGTVVLLVVFRKQLRSIGKKLKFAGKKFDIGQELREEGRKGGVQTYPDSWYKDTADNLQANFEGCGYYVDAQIVSLMKKLKTNTDYLLLNKAFGVRRFDGCNWEFNFGWDEGNLGQSLNGELDYDEISDINNHFKSVGITYSV